MTHVVDTSGAYIPGHGTPTVILFGRNRRPVAATVRAAMGIKGEPATPTDPAHGHVWTAIIDQIDCVGSQSAFLSVNDTPRQQFGKHPWSIGGGGAAELKLRLDDFCSSTLDQLVNSVGPPSFTGIDEMFFAPPESLLRSSVAPELIRPLCTGEQVRDWDIVAGVSAFVPYESNQDLIQFDAASKWVQRLWRCRACSEGMVSFARKTRKDLGEIWWSWYRWIPERYRTPLSIVFAFVATHNHFVLVRGGKVFKQSAPVIKLSADATEDQHLALLGPLNSSIACFWLKQVAHNKGSTVDDKGARQRTAAFEDFYEFTATQLETFPLSVGRPLALARQIDTLSQRLSLLLSNVFVSDRLPTARLLADCHNQFDQTVAQMITLQEELDWECYRLYGILDVNLRSDYPPAIKLGQRAFEIVLARRIAAGEEDTTWFLRHGSTPITEIPAEWPEEYKQLVQQRIELIESDRNIGLIERPEYKRRWNIEPWEQQQEKALRGWLLDQLESYFDLDGRMNDEKQITAEVSLREPRLTNFAQLADLARQDKDFMQVAELYTGRMDFDVANLVGDLVASESVPCLPVLRYKASGLDKRVAWERTWELQRMEDAIDALFEELTAKARRHEEVRLEEEIASSLRDSVVEEIDIATRYLVEAVHQNVNLANDLALKPVTEAAKRAKQRAVGDIPVPPKYTSADFLNSNYWRLRGKLDVPKERWVSFPHCEREDGTLVIAWAGYDHLQLARAIAERYEQAKELEGRKLVPLLACIGQLISWLKQWHNELDPEFGMRMGDYFEDYLAEEAKALGMSVDEVIAWRPPQKAKKLNTKTRRHKG